MTIDLYRTPLLPARETARHLRMPESTLNVWLSAGSDEPLVHAVRPERRGWPRVPFVGIVEAHVLRALRVGGLPMDEIRRAAVIVRAEFDDPYALAKPRIATDGVAVFVRLADKSLIRARDQQLIRLPQYAHLDVTVDPRINSGRPTIARRGLRVTDVMSRLDAGESADQVAADYALTTDEVRSLVPERV